MFIFVTFGECFICAFFNVSLFLLVPFACSIRLAGKSSIRLRPCNSRFLWVYVSWQLVTMIASMVLSSHPLSASTSSLVWAQPSLEIPCLAAFLILKVLLPVSPSSSSVKAVMLLKSSKDFGSAPNKTSPNSSKLSYTAKASGAATYSDTFHVQGSYFNCMAPLYAVLLVTV